MSEHTKSTWEIGDTFSTHNSPVRFWETSVTSLAGRVALATGASKEEARANAHLIAAAPELLEILKAIHDAYYVGHKTDAGFVKAMSYFSDEMRAAISKAEGK